MTMRTVVAGFAASFIALMGAAGAAQAGGGHGHGHGHHQFFHGHKRVFIFLGDGHGCRWMWRKYLRTGDSYWKHRYFRCID